MASTPTEEAYYSYVENALKEYLTPIVRWMFPVLESLEEIRRFIQTLAETVTQKVVAETPAEVGRGRPDAALDRAGQWLRQLCWNDVVSYPADPIAHRTMRLQPIIMQASKMPTFQGVGRYDAFSVASQYDFLRTILAPVLKRHPGPSRIKIPAASQGADPHYRMRRRWFLNAETDKKKAQWTEAREQAAQTILSVPWWPQGKEFWFNDDELSSLTPRKAALTVLARNTDRSVTAVWGQVKIGHNMLTAEQNTALDEAWKAHRHAPEVCQILGCKPPAR